MKFRYSMSFTHPNQSKRSRCVLEDGSRFFGLFRKKKKLRLITEKYGGTRKDVTKCIKNALKIFIWEGESSVYSRK